MNIKQRQRSLEPLGKTSFNSVQLPYSKCGAESGTGTYISETKATSKLKCISKMPRTVLINQSYCNLNNVNFYMQYKNS